VKSFHASPFSSAGTPSLNHAGLLVPTRVFFACRWSPHNRRTKLARKFTETECPCQFGPHRKIVFPHQGVWNPTL